MYFTKGRKQAGSQFGVGYGNKHDRSPNIIGKLVMREVRQFRAIVPAANLWLHASSWSVSFNMRLITTALETRARQICSPRKGIVVLAQGSTLLTSCITPISTKPITAQTAIIIQPRFLSNGLLLYLSGKELVNDDVYYHNFNLLFQYFKSCPLHLYKYSLHRMSITLPVPKYVHVITKVAVDSIEVQEELQYPAIID